MGYFVFQTIDWKQVPFEDGDFVKYFELDQKSVGQYKFTVPKVKEDSVYSVLTFPSSEYYKNIREIGSSKRAIIKP